MSDIGSVKIFLDSIGYDEKRRASLDIQKGHYPFITISREAGSGGHSLAQAIIKEIEKEEGDLFQGWQMFDHEICKLISDDPELSVSMRSMLSSECRSEVEDIVSELIIGTTPQVKVIKKMFRIIRTLATFGKVVIVGRASSILTRELPTGIHVRLIASLENRVKRMSQFLKMDEKEAKKLIKEQDKGRARLIGTYFNKKIEDPLLYDVVWNTDTVAIDEIACALVGMVKHKASLMKK